MSFDPTLPAPNSLISSAELRAQFNGLKDLHDALAAGVITDVQIDNVITLGPGEAATATGSVTGHTLHLSFGIPSGANGADGPMGSSGSDGAPGVQGPPGEVTNATLAGAIAGTARNPVGLAALDTPFADPDAESLRVFCNTLLGLLFRPPV